MTFSSIDTISSFMHFYSAIAFKRIPLDVNRYQRLLLLSCLETGRRYVILGKQETFTPLVMRLELFPSYQRRFLLATPGLNNLTLSSPFRVANHPMGNGHYILKELDIFLKDRDNLFD